MGLCLLTELKGVFDNENLDYLNTVVLYVNAQSQNDDALRFSISPLAGQSLDAIIKDDVAVFYDSNNQFTSPYGRTAKIVGISSLTDDGKQIVDAGMGNYKILVRNSPGLDNMYLGSSISVNLKSLKKSIGLTSINARTGVLQCVGDIANLSNLVEMTSVQLGGAECVGNLASLAKCIKLTLLNINTSGITSSDGTMTPLFAGMVANGRNSGQMRVVSNANLGTAGANVDVVFYPVSPEHPNGYEIA